MAATKSVREALNEVDRDGEEAVKWAR